MISPFLGGRCQLFNRVITLTVGYRGRTAGRRYRFGNIESDCIVFICESIVELSYGDIPRRQTDRVTFIRQSTWVSPEVGPTVTILK